MEMKLLHSLIWCHVHVCWMPRSSCWVCQSECWKGPRQKACTAMAWHVAHVELEGIINSWVRLLSIPAYGTVGFNHFEAISPYLWTYNHQRFAASFNSKFEAFRFPHLEVNNEHAWGFTYLSHVPLKFQIPKKLLFWTEKKIVKR